MNIPNTPEEDPHAKPQNDRSAALPLQVPAMLSGAVVSSIPFYGYDIRSPLDDQWIFLVILATWLATWVIAAGSIAMAIFMPPKSLLAKCCMGVLFLYILAAGVIGWGGVYHSFRELVAG